MNAPKRRQPVLEQGANLALFYLADCLPGKQSADKKMPPEGGSER
jgi:hypothetical protein